MAQARQASSYISAFTGAVLAAGAAFTPFAAAAQEAKPVNAETAVSVQQPDIIIRYGSEIPAEEIELWVRDLATVNVRAKAETGLDAPECAALVRDGKEIYRYGWDSIFDGSMASVAQGLVEGDSILEEDGSDCERDVAALTNG